jgi:hypothetical protein
MSASFVTLEDNVGVSHKKYIPDPVVARDRYHVNPRTLPRWDDKPELGFPPPIYINGRKYRDEERLDQFDRERAVESARDAANARRRRQPRQTAQAAEQTDTNA